MKIFIDGLEYPKVLYGIQYEDGEVWLEGSGNPHPWPDDMPDEGVRYVRFDLEKAVSNA